MAFRIDKEESRRLDALKVLMCVFVLIIHAFSDEYTAPGNGYGLLYIITFVISCIVCDCAVPVFVLISSVLLYSRPYSFGTNLKKKCQSLLVPYLIFNSLWIAMILLKNWLVPDIGSENGESLNFAAFTLFDWLDAYLGLTDDYKPLLTLLWYVRDLFLLNLLAMPIKKLVDWLPIPVLILTLALWISGISIPGISNYSLCFFVLGYYLVKYDIHVTAADHPKGKILVPAVYVLVLAADVLTGRQLAVNQLFVLVSVVFWVRCSKWLVRFSKPIRLILPATFFIYLSHRFVYTFVQTLGGESLGWFLIAYAVKPPIAMAVLLGIFYFLKRFLPGVLGVLVGGRMGKTPAPTKK